MFDFYRLAAAVPCTEVANVSSNIESIKEFWLEADKQQASVVGFPELAITGYSCADLFNQSQLLDQAVEGLQSLVDYSRKLSSVAVVGMPLIFQSRLYNCAVVLQSGKIAGVVPKTHLANKREYYEKRWFSSGESLKNETISLCGQIVGFGADQIFSFGKHFSFGVEICEDLWHVIPPSCHQALAGATLCVNISASNELIGKAEYRRDLVRHQSARCFNAYLYTSAGVGESSTDVVFSGHALIAENNTVLSESQRFARNGELIFADVDFEKLNRLRMADSSFGDVANTNERFRTVVMQKPTELTDFSNVISKFPFVPEVQELREERCLEITQIQIAALTKRLLHTKMQAAVIGVSGGLDSTLALLVTCEAFDAIGLKRSQIIGVSMPAEATSEHTFANSKRLAENLGISFQIIPIDEAVKLHFRDIKHDRKTHDTTYENVQARERTQILMNLANKQSALVIGTGDLSEIALGWSTYNGDHMSMYNVNCGIPKTLVQYLVKWHAQRLAPEATKILQSILATPISPELIPASDKNNITHKTEDLLGPYALHDFFLYHFARLGFSPPKIAFLAAKAFHGEFTAQEINQWLRVFLSRFFANQFKRSCMPDGPKVGTIALSPRGDWRMASDASVADWLAEV